MKKDAVFGFLLGVAAALNAQNVSNTNNILAPPDFGNLSYEDGGGAVDHVVEAVVRGKWMRLESGYVTNLVYQLRKESLPAEKKVLIIYLLGELRASDRDSLEALIKYIDLKTRPDPKPSGEFSMRWGPVPAREALVKIGNPTVVPILNHLPNDVDPIRRSLMCTVLKQIEGKETATRQIKQKFSDESDPGRKANLELALKEMEK